MVGFVKLVLDHGATENSGNATNPQLHGLGLFNKIFSEKRSSHRYQSRNLLMGVSRKREVPGLLKCRAV